MDKSSGGRFGKSKIMYFPITIVDNFYSNFDEVKEYATNLQFFKDEQHGLPYTMPGLKSKFLHDINPSFFRQSALKILTLFFLNGNVSYECRTRFEKITPYGEEYNKEGWIHSDDDNRLSALFFIDGQHEEGTSFFKKKNVGVEMSTFEEKRLLFSGYPVDPHTYNKKLKEHNEKYTEILNVSCIPNRLIVFDSSCYHRANGLGTTTKPRLIQTFFFGKVTSDFFPIPEKERI